MRPIPKRTQAASSSPLASDQGSALAQASPHKLMRDIFDGARAGLFGALILTLWSLLHAMTPLENLSEVSGFLYVATSFGILGLPQLLYGAAIGALLLIWKRGLRESFGAQWPQTLAQPTRDRRAAAALLFVPIAAGLVAATVGGAHLFITSKFVRPMFQAIGLTLISLIATVGVVAAAPLGLKLLGFGTALLPSKEESKRPLATMITLGALGAIALIVLIVGYRYAAQLNVWPATTTRMALASILLTPALMAALHKLNKKLDRVAWNIGLPVAGALVTAICFNGAWSWSSANADMRQAIVKESALVSFMANHLQRFADHDKDGYANSMGGFDCDDNDPNVYPGAIDLPGNGLDEDCDGQDKPMPSGENHVSRKIIRLALNAATKAAAKSATPAQDKLKTPPKNVLVILVDTLRQDHLSYAGYSRNTSPNIDALAKQASVFSNAYATAPHTPRSIPSIFLSRYASHVKWKGAQFNYPKVLPENLSVFEVLQEKGWKSYGYSSHFYFDEKRGLGEGFERWDNEGAGTIAESNDDIAAPRIWQKLEPELERLAQAQKAQDAAPFGVFVHLFEPHSRWIGHKEYDFGEAKDGHERHINNYDSEIAFVDAYVGKIIQKLKDTGLYEDTIIVITSDHGEAFKDHGLYFHGQNIYNEVIRVPLLIHVPGWPARTISEPVSLVDIAPTLLDLQDITIPTSFEGISLALAMSNGEALPNRPIFAELLPYTNWKEHHKAVIYKNFKLISELTAGTTELYDLAKDPQEKDNLISKDKANADLMRQKLQDWMSQ